ncbi:hypothetical protein AMK16_02335 [Streptomyces sp. CB00455]|uniref:ATP-binding protein n=1 Tax=Streptomyces sp. CB00455 TaxID=1703927 RepID=UPI00093EFA7F|nr:ATP-binding protein [Streptomyces sp. CB00455]OKK22077.1 hypothetical protein AMK16_02335 [Streptomyces sp. CB00455]
MDVERRQSPGLRLGQPATASEARAFVRAVFEQAVELGWASTGDGVRDALADILLVTSELATNAVRHGGGLTGFSARLEPDAMVLTVVDASPRLPVALVKEQGPATPGGFGWPLICRLAKHVSVTPLAGAGKSIEVILPLQ